MPRDLQRLRLDAGARGLSRGGSIYVARLGAEGVAEPAGVVELRLDRHERAALRTELTARQRPSESRRRFVPVAAGIRLEIEFHGSSNQALRDPVVRNVLIDGTQ